MTTAQMESFTDAQAVAVTDDQQAVMSAAQRELLGEVSTGGQEEVPEVTTPPPASTG